MQIKKFEFVAKTPFFYIILGKPYNKTIMRRLEITKKKYFGDGRFLRILKHAWY